MRLYRTEAIILKKNNYSENDRIITLFSPTKGKIKVIAKGSRKIKSRFSGILETGNIVTATIYEKKKCELSFLSSCDLKYSWDELRKNFEFTEAFFYMLSVIDELMPEAESSADIYNLLLKILKEYDSQQSIFNLITYFDLKIAKIMGIAPMIKKCAVCGERLRGSKIAYSKKCGGLICGECRLKNPVCGYISLGALKALLHIDEEGLSRGINVRLSKSLKEDISNFLYPFIVFHMGKDIKGRKVLKQISLI